MVDKNFDITVQEFGEGFRLICHYLGVQVVDNLKRFFLKNVTVFLSKAHVTKLTINKW